MTDLRQYRLNNLNEIDHFMVEMGTDAFLDFERRVHNVLEKLKVMRYFDIEEKISPDQQELFIKLCCSYIEKHPEYEFNNNYTQIWRKESYEQWKMATARRPICQRERQQNDSRANV